MEANPKKQILTELGDSTLQKKIRREQENLLGDEPFYIQTLIP